MRLSLSACCCLTLLAGCTDQPGAGNLPESPRFAHSAIHKTSAPWDGPAISLHLSENPIPNKSPAAPFVAVQINRSLKELSGQCFRLEEKESRTGIAQWVPRKGEGEPVAWAEITFAAIEEGKPVVGEYDVAFKDGKRERGRFEAAWQPPDGPGG
jgi:hypothetical protein